MQRVLVERGQDAPERQRLEALVARLSDAELLTPRLPGRRVQEPRSGVHPRHAGRLLCLTPALFEQLQSAGGMVYIEPDGRGDPHTLKPVLDAWQRSGTTSQSVDPKTLVDFTSVDAAPKDLGPRGSMARR